jgi:hypothetical protein
MQHADYWSGSSLATWLRRKFNAPKPESATLTEWKAWREQDLRQHPILHRITEDHLGQLQDLVYWLPHQFNNLRYWFRLRFIDRPYLLDTRLPKGAYHGIEARIMHGLFETLVEFVEVEKAWMLVVFDAEAKKRYRIPVWQRVRSLRWFKRWRSAEAGLEHLAWESSLDSPDLTEFERSPLQAQAAREIIALYTWWVDERPVRPDPFDLSGLTAATKDIPMHELLDGPDREDVDLAREACDAIEQRYEEEDEAMLIRLIRLRRSLWT